MHGLSRLTSGPYAALLKRGKVAPPFTWTPASLTGAMMVWYDPSDLSSMFQDSAGTVPAAVDSPVGRINDKSGNGKHATQATSASRPMLRNYGNLYWLEFDGLDDYLTTGSFALGTTAALAAATRIMNAVNAYASVFDGVASDGTDRVVLGASASPSNSYRLYAGVNLAGGTRDTVDHVMVGSLSGSTGTLEVNKVSVASGSIGGSYQITSGMTVGSDPINHSQILNGRIYGGVMLARALTADEKSNLNTYLGRKAGLSL